MTTKQNIDRYIAAMLASGADSFVQSSSAFLGVAGVHAVSDTIPAMTLPQLGGLAILAFCRGVLLYLKSNPISAEVAKLQLPISPAIPLEDKTKKESI